MAERDAQIGAFTSPGLSAAVTVPTNLASDIVIIRAYCEANTTVSAWPSGFTPFTPTGFVSSRGIMAWAWKRITTPDTGTYTVTFAASSGGAQIAASSWSGRDTSASPFSYTAQNQSTSSASSPPTLTGTSTVGDDLSYVVNEWLGTVGMSATDNATSMVLVDEDTVDGVHHWKLENVAGGADSVATSSTAGSNTFWVTLVAIKAASGGSAATATGSITLTGTVTAQAPVTASGSISLTGTAAASGGGGGGTPAPPIAAITAIGRSR